MEYDLVVVGGGAAGLAAARTAVRTGRRVVLVVEGPVGGDCTFTGCVPSKTLIAAAAAGLPYEPHARIAGINPGTILRASGRVGEYKGHLALANPRYELIPPD